MFKVNNGNTRTKYEICSKLTIKTPEPRHWRLVFLFFSFVPLVFLFFSVTLFFSVCNVNFEHVIAAWDRSNFFQTFPL